jgi:hypothetical protein
MLILVLNLTILKCRGIAIIARELIVVKEFGCKQAD